jgi:hypothetical protein
VVWRFSAGDTVTLHFTLNRALASAPSGRIVLTAVNSSAVVHASRPWLAPGNGSAGLRMALAGAASTPSGRRLNDVLPGCSDVAISQSGSYCGVSVMFDQVVPADAFLDAGATFQSNPGHGLSNPIDITFNPPAASVTVTAYDPTFDGNSMTAFDADGAVIGTVPFPGNGTPGTLTTQTGTLSGSIARVLLTPAPLDYVAYSMSVTFNNVSGIKLSLAPGTTGLLPPSYQRFQSSICNVSTVVSTRPYQVRVTPANPASTDSVNNRQISLTLAALQFSGAHAHDDGARPTGSFVSGSQVSSTTVVSGANGVAAFTFFAPEPSGQYVVTASTPGAASTTDTITVGYALTPLPVYANYTFTGDKSIHPGSHNTTLAMADALREISDSLHALSGNVLGINDESLPLGGLFDINANWATPHCSHRRGIDADIRDRVLSAAEVRYIKLVWPQTSDGARWLQESDHIHLTGRR